MTTSIDEDVDVTTSFAEAFLWRISRQPSQSCPVKLIPKARWTDYIISNWHTYKDPLSGTYQISGPPK